MDVPVSGHCDARFRGVQDEFARNFAERGEVGAAVCVVVDGATVVDLFGGLADRSAGTPWQPDTLVDFYSVGKPFLAVLALQLVDAGLIALDDPIARVWPEFAAEGKGGATLRHALCHRAGVPAIHFTGLGEGSRPIQVWSGAQPTAWRTRGGSDGRRGRLSEHDARFGKNF